MDPVIGIDLGGTKIFGGIVMPGAVLSGERYVAHAQSGAGGDAFDRLCRFIDGLRAEGGGAFRGIGVGAPGITRLDGTIAAAPSLGWRDFPLAERLSKVTGLPVKVENDVNLAALGELHFGAGRGTRNLVCISVGTGIGGAVIIDGKLHRGRNDAAGELGALLPGREFLSWRNREWGALESVASGSGIATRAGLRAEEVFAAAAEGDPAAQTIFEETMDYLAVAVSAVQSLLDPERIVLGGGVGRAADRILPAIERRLAQAMPFPPMVVASQLGYRAAVLGSAALY